MVGDFLKIDRIKMLLLENGISLEPGLSDEVIQKVEMIYVIEQLKGKDGIVRLSR